MEVVNLLLAAAGCLFVLVLRPVFGLAVYIILSVWYPYCVGTVSIGSIDFSVGRIVIIALFAKIFLATDLAKGFRLIRLDKLVIILFVAEVVAGLKNVEVTRLVEYRLGDFFDMALPYFAVRLTVNSKEEYISLLKTIACATAVLALFACFECITGHNFLILGRPIGVPDVRWKYFHRAQVTFRHSI